MKGRKPVTGSAAKCPHTLSTRVNSHEFKVYKAHAQNQGKKVSHWIKDAIDSQYKADLSTTQKPVNNDNAYLQSIITNNKSQREEVSRVFDWGIAVFLLLFSKK